MRGMFPALGVLKLSYLIETARELQEAADAYKAEIARRQPPLEPNWTYPPCPTPKCKGKILTISQMATDERPARCAECATKELK